MSLSLFDASIPVMTRALSNLAGILAKAEAHAAAHKIDPAIFIQARLYPDMYPLVRQIQIATDVAKGGAARLAGQTPPSYEDSESTFAELQARLAKTLAFLNTFTPEHINGSEERIVTLKAGKRDLSFQGQAYLLDFVLPNIFFHSSTTYAILRHWGVDLGKADFLGSQ
jgi:hypothetical protein